MKKKIFAVSDIHGHATLLRNALKEAGFDPLNKEHLLVIVGDCFDRGSENKAVLNLIKSIKNKVLIRGNHEDMLIKTIERGKLRAVEYYNGTDITLYQFLGSNNIDENGEITGNFSACDTLCEFANSMLDYFETENYVFTHGWLPLDLDAVPEKIKDGWKYVYFGEWFKARFLEWNKHYSESTILEGKTIVCGHRSCSYGAQIDPARSYSDHSPFIKKGIAAIDACTISSGKVNVLVLEDEVPEPRTFSMELRDDMFELVKKGIKTVEMRMLDEKRASIKVGDRIEFTSDSDQNKKVTVTVTGLHSYPSFYALALDFSPISLGFYDKTPREIMEIMEKIYSEKLKHLRPLAIRITL